MILYTGIVTLVFLIMWIETHHFIIKMKRYTNMLVILVTRFIDFNESTRTCSTQPNTQPNTQLNTPSSTTIIPASNSIKRDENSVVHHTVTKFVSSRWDNYEINVYKNEKKWLQLLSGSKYFPKPILFDDVARIITTQYCGTQLTIENIPTNFMSQVEELLNELDKYNCRHNDIKPSEILVHNNQLYLVDFGWAHITSEENPISWPKALGGKFKCNPLNDRGSMYNSIVYILCKIINDKIQRNKVCIANINKQLSVVNPVRRFQLPDNIKLEDEVEWWDTIINSLL